MRHLHLLAIALLVSPASATILLSSESFEGPSFTAGDLDGQSGWQGVGGGAGSATVQSALSLTGSQALRIDRGANSDDFWLRTIDAEPSGRFVSIDWDMLVEPASNAGSAFGPFFGVRVFDDSNGSVNELAGFGVDAASEEIVYLQGGTGFISAVGTAELGVWNHFRIEIDFENDRYRGFLNGGFLIETGFVDGAEGIDGLTDADLVAVSGGGDAASQALTGTAYVDNYLVRDGLRADYNGDGVVDAADYAVWRDSQGEIGFALAADGDANGVVNTADYDLWVASYGASNTISPPAVAIPEPATFCGVALLAGLAIASIQRI